MLHENDLGSSDLLFECGTRSQLQIGHVSVSLGGVSGEVPTQTYIQSQILAQFPVVLGVETVGCRPISEVLEWQSSGFRIEIDSVFFKRFIGGKVERIFEIKRWTV